MGWCGQLIENPEFEEEDHPYPTKFHGDQVLLQVLDQFDLGRLLCGLRFHPEDPCCRRRKIRQQEERSERRGEKEETWLLLTIRNMTIDLSDEIYSIYRK